MTPELITLARNPAPALRRGLHRHPEVPGQARDAVARGHAMTRTLAAFLLLATSAFAQTPPFAPGDLITPTRDYDHQTDTFTDAPPQGEAGACFRVDKVTPDAIDITLIAGPYHPWWSDVPFAPGHTDSLIRAEGYAENHPDAPPLALHALVYTVVPACPPSS